MRITETTTDLFGNTVAAQDNRTRDKEHRKPHAKKSDSRSSGHSTDQPCRRRLLDGTDCQNQRAPQAIYPVPCGPRRELVAFVTPCKACLAEFMALKFMDIPAWYVAKPEDFESRNASLAAQWPTVIEEAEAEAEAMAPTGEPK